MEVSYTSNKDKKTAISSNILRVHIRGKLTSELWDSLTPSTKLAKQLADKKARMYKGNLSIVDVIIALGQVGIA